MLAQDNFSAAKQEINTIIRSKENEGHKIPEDVANIAAQPWFSQAQATSSNKEFYQAHSASAEELLFKDLPWIDANIGEIFTTPTKDGKKGKLRRKILIKTSTIPREVIVPEAKLDGKNLKLGDAIRVKGEFNNNQQFILFSLERRESKSDWDVLHKSIGVVDHINLDKQLIHFIVNKEIDGVISLANLTDSFSVGDSIAVTLYSHTGKHGMVYRAHQAKATKDEPSNKIKMAFYEEIVSIHNGMGFISINIGSMSNLPCSSIFIPPSLVEKHAMKDRIAVSGVAILNYNPKRDEWGWKAVSIHIGEMQLCSTSNSTP